MSTSFLKFWYQWALHISYKVCCYVENPELSSALLQQRAVQRERACSPSPIFSFSGQRRVESQANSGQTGSTPAPFNPTQSTSLARKAARSNSRCSSTRWKEWWWRRWHGMNNGQDWRGEEVFLKRAMKYIQDSTSQWDKTRNKFKDHIFRATTITAILKKIFFSIC